MAEDLELNFIGGPAALQGLAGAGIKRQSRWERRKDKKRQKQVLNLEQTTHTAATKACLKAWQRQGRQAFMLT